MTTSAKLSRRALAAGLVLAPLAACGIKGPNKRPPDGDPAYPRAYPPRSSVVPEGRRAPGQPAAGQPAAGQPAEGEQDSQ